MLHDMALGCHIQAFTGAAREVREELQSRQAAQQLSCGSLQPANGTSRTYGTRPADYTHLLGRVPAAVAPEKSLHGTQDAAIVY